LRLCLTEKSVTERFDNESTMNLKSCLSVVVCATAFWITCSGSGQAQFNNGAATEVDRLTLTDVASGAARILDLTHMLNEKNAYWPGPWLRTVPPENVRDDRK